MPAFPQPYGKLYHQTPGFVPIRQVLLMWIFPIMMNFKYLSLLRAICISCPVKCLFKFLIHFWGIVHPCVLASHFLGALQTLGRLVFCLWYMWKYFQESFNFLSVFFFFCHTKAVDTSKFASTGLSTGSIKHSTRLGSQYVWWKIKFTEHSHPTQVYMAWFLEQLHCFRHYLLDISQWGLIGPWRQKWITVKVLRGKHQGA